MFRLLILCFLLLPTTEAFAARTIETNETWSGKIMLTDSVNVAANVLLTIKPGTEVRFAPDTAISVQGRMLARGTATQPIQFLSVSDAEQSFWPGISFLGSSEESELSYVQFRGATQAVTVNGSRLAILSSVVQGGVKGIYMGAEAVVKIDGLEVSQMSKDAIEASTHSRGSIRNCRIKSVDGPGILLGKQTAFLIQGNRIKNAKVAIVTSGDAPPIADNVIVDCEVGIAISQASPQAVIRGNKISGAKKGIACQQFASPTIERNVLEDCVEAIECFQGSSPIVTQNRFAGNRRAFSATQMCNPQLMNNDFTNNETAIYLHLSSYAQIHGNNFEKNITHVMLDNMSYDWELRANKKPMRNRQKQNDLLAKQGRAMPKSVHVEVKSEGFVDARENYWGVETTAEMVGKGASAEVSTIVDGYDVPILTYDGWPGEYKKDRVNYSGWKATRIAGAGP